MSTIQLLDYLGTLAFAASGALKGLRRDMDIFGVFVLAAVTAIGGGTIRDALLNQQIFWLDDWWYMAVVLAAALVVFFLYRWVLKTEKELLILDAIGLGVFTAIGAGKAWAAGTGLVGVVTMACLTGVGGGMIRDVLARDVPVVLREEIYASASIAGALAFWALRTFETHETLATLVAALLTIAIRIVSIVRGWRLPRRHLDPKDSPREAPQGGPQ